MAAAHCKQDKERIECLEWWVARLLAVDATNFECNEERRRDLARGLKVGRLFEDLMARERRHRRWLRTRSISAACRACWRGGRDGDRAVIRS